MNKMTPDQIRSAKSAVNTIRDIDNTITWFLKDTVEDTKKWGLEMRRVLGCNRLTQFKSDYLGGIVVYAVINALLLKRFNLVEIWGCRIEFPEPPCTSYMLVGEKDVV